MRINMSYTLIKRYWKPIFVLILPVILCPLIFIGDTKEGKCSFVVLLMALYWMAEVMPLAITAFLPLVLFPILGIMEAEDVPGNYFQDTQLVFIGGLMMAVAIEECRLHERLALLVLLGVGTTPRWLMLGFQLATALLSMFMSNTATTAMMLPIALAVIAEMERSTTNDNQQQLPMSHLASAADSLPPTDEQCSVKDRQLTTNLVEMQPKISNRVHKGILLSICYSANIGGMGTLIGTGSNIVLSGQLSRLYKSQDTVTFASWLFFAVPPMLVALFFSWLWLQIIFLGFRSTTGKESQQNVKSVLLQNYRKLGSMSAAEIQTLLLFVILVLLWLTREPKFVVGWGALFPPDHVSDGTVAISVAVLLFIVPRSYRRTECADDNTPLLTWAVVQKKFSWSVVMLIGGGYAMADGVKTSGLSEWLGSKLIRMTSMSHWVFVVIATTMVTFLTEFSSNVATASIFIPLIASIADEAEVNPLYYILPVTLACSFAFMLPVATPPNAIVFSSNRIKIIDMITAGIGMNILCILVVILSIHTWGWWVYDLGNVPEWAHFNSSAVTQIPN